MAKNEAFRALGLKGPLMATVAQLGFEQPTPVQEKAIKPLLSGQDVIAIAQTGTGKTAAYGLPILQKIWESGLQAQCLVVLPTRELTVQSLQMLTDYAAGTGIRVAGFYGGKALKHQLKQLEEEAQVIVSTPKRLMELQKAGGLYRKRIKHFVLDEADRLMDMGFMPQLRSILEILPSKRQNVLLSATFPEKVERLSQEFLDFPTRIELSVEGTPAEQVSQISYEVPNLKSKIRLLHHLVEQEEIEKALIFVRKKANADNIAKYLERKELGKARAIHANKGQNIRLNGVEAFRQGELNFLVATDLASRGMDIPEVSHVVNFSAPLNPEDYVHRIGRTGRAGNTGKAINFVSPEDQWHFRRIEGYIKAKLDYAPWPEEVEKAKTDFVEQQEMNRAIDEQRRKDDPDFKGAFHEKKRKPHQKRKSNKPPGKSTKKNRKRWD